MSATAAKQIEHSFTLHVGGSPERVFPLLCPIREYDWIDGWTCQLVHSQSGVVEPGCIFMTDHPPEGRTIWVTVLHDPAAQRVEFLRVTPDSHVSRMALSVAREDDGASLQVRYAFTALDERGAAFLGLLEDGRVLGERAERLGRSIDHYLRTGTKLEAVRAAAG